MRTLSLAVCAGFVAVIACPVRAQEDGSAVANVPEAFPEMLAGPNSSEPALPKPPPPSPIKIEPGEEPGENKGAIHLSLGVDFTNAYFSRGLRQEDDGLVAQPWVTVGFDLITREDWSLQGYVGGWNSLHSEKTGAADTEDSISTWYESDAYFGVTAVAGRWELGAQYGWFTSPNSAFTTVEELQFSAAYDDADALGDWALSPQALLVIETGDGTSDGQGRGTYGALSVEPGCECGWMEGLAFSFPAVAGFSVSDYYEHSDGSDDFLGFISVGAKATYTIPCDKRCGDWSCYLGANVLLLGDLAKEVNDNDGTALVVSAGVSMEY